MSIEPSDRANPAATDTDVLVVGAGAAGLATAIFARRANARLRVTAIDGAARLGAKILVSGGGRCNVTNRRVTPDDFHGGSPHLVRRVLQALPVPQTVDFFAEIGVPLHEEERGRLFPDANDAHAVLSALLREARRVGVMLETGRRVVDITRSHNAFRVIAAGGAIAYRPRRVVLATGGLALPKTGSDGAGYQIARQLGHSIVPTTPALAPLVLEGDFHRPLSGLSSDVALTLRAAGPRPRVVCGPMLWTHFGISGPATLDLSGAWHRARIDRLGPVVTASFAPGLDVTAVERRLCDHVSRHGRMHVRTAIAADLPERLAGALLEHARVPADTPLAQLSREARRRLALALAEFPLAIRDSRGYTHAEVTAGGVALGEIDAGTMESRVCPGLHLVGEILDVDGRLGGFNFQWAWASGFVAGTALAKDHVPRPAIG